MMPEFMAQVKLKNDVMLYTSSKNLTKHITLKVKTFFGTRETYTIQQYIH